MLAATQPRIALEAATTLAGVKDELGSMYWRSEVHAGLGAAQVHLGEPEEGARLLRMALGWARQDGMSSNVNHVRAVRRVHLAGIDTAAVRQLDEALQLA
jgi:hypothetical protein